MPGDPWSLLLLVGADKNNRHNDGIWVIPVDLKCDDKTFGFEIAIQFEREFPGPIKPVPDPGPPPKMKAAEKYVTKVAGE